MSHNVVEKSTSMFSLSTSHTQYGFLFFCFSMVFCFFLFFSPATLVRAVTFAWVSDRLRIHPLCEQGRYPALGSHIQCGQLALSILNISEHVAGICQQSTVPCRSFSFLCSSSFSYLGEKHKTSQTISKYVISGGQKLLLLSS